MNKKERKSVEKLCSSIEDPVGKDSIKLFMEKLEKWEKMNSQLMKQKTCYIIQWMK